MEPLLFVVPLVILLILGGAAALTRSARPDPAARSTALQTGEGEWFARPHPGFTWGTLRITHGLVSFTPDGTDRPAWQQPAPGLTVHQPGVLGAYVTLESAAIGRVQLEVSASRGARWREAGDLRDLADRPVAEDIVRILLGHGARLG